MPRKFQARIIIKELTKKNINEKSHGTKPKISTIKVNNKKYQDEDVSLNLSFHVKQNAFKTFIE